MEMRYMNYKNGDIVMRIEDYWLDDKLYSVSFEKKIRRVVHKIIIVPSTEIENVEKIVQNRFNAVYMILKIDELDSCLIFEDARMV